MKYTEKEFNRFFDNTCLKPYTTSKELKEFCRKSALYGFRSVAVNTGAVKQCAEYLAGTGVSVDAAVGFPLGITTVQSKLCETAGAIADGAQEIDYVINIGRLKDGNRAYILDEMKSIVGLCREKRVISKVIFENCYLTDDEKKAMCDIALEVLPDFIKTSTGFGTGAATVADVRLMKAAVGSKINVKAAGGIKNLATCISMINAGATRIGCSNSCAIADEYTKTL